MSCRGWASYSGPCGALDCTNCYPGCDQNEDEDWDEDVLNNVAHLGKCIAAYSGDSPGEVSLEDDLDGTHYDFEVPGKFLGRVRQYEDIRVRRRIVGEIREEVTLFQAGILTGNYGDYCDVPDYLDVGAPQTDAIRAFAEIVAEYEKQELLNKVWADIEATQFIN